MLSLPIRPDQRNGPSHRSFLEHRGLQTSNPLSSEKGDAHSSSMRAAAGAIHHVSVQSGGLRADAGQWARRAESGPSVAVEATGQPGYAEDAYPFRNGPTRAMPRNSNRGSRLSESEPTSIISTGYRWRLGRISRRTDWKIRCFGRKCQIHQRFVVR